MHIELRKALDSLKSEVTLREENLIYFKEELARKDKTEDEYKLLNLNYAIEDRLLIAAKVHLRLFMYAINQSLNF